MALDADPPVPEAESALPPLGARILAFLAIVVSGACGGLIGYAVTDLQCTDGCPGWAGLGFVVGALFAAIGVAIVAVLALRAMGEWKAIDQRARRS